MYRLLEFIRSIYITLLFITLECVAIYAYVSSDSYAQAKLLTYSAGLVGVIDGTSLAVKDYFSLRQKNILLTNRILELESALAGYKVQQQDSLLTALGYINSSGVTYTAAHVVSNKIHNRDNYLVVNRGLQHGIRGGMAVVTINNEIVGVVVESSQHYSIIMSILHSDFRTSGMVEGDPNIAAIRWDGVDHKCVDMSDLSRYTTIEIGSKVVTTGYSQVFPEGVTIGEVDSFDLDPVQSSITAKVRLAIDMRSIRDVLIVHDSSIDEASRVINSFFEREQE